MSLGRTVVAVSVDHDRLFALAATVTGSRIEVTRGISAQVPANIDSKDPAAFGAWLGSRLKEAGVSRARLVFAVTRGEVVLKRLRLPRPTAGDVDLAGMVRLQMARQLTLTLEGTAIDYVLLGEDAAAADVATTQVSVLAGALPGDRVDWYRKVARAAGCRLERVGLLASGAAAILASVSQRHSGPILGIASGPASMEFVVVQDGHLAFARAAEVGGDTPPTDPDAAREALVQRAAVEAKRTWMSYRVGQDSAEIDAVVVPGEGDLARQIGRRCGEALEMQWRLAVLPDSVKFPSDMPEEQRLMAAPLAGLIGERILAKPTLDFAHPRKAPDRAAQRRQKALLAALILLAVGGVGFLYTSMELGRLKQRLEDAREAGAELRKEQQAHLRDQARLGHLQAWRSAGVDWLAHANWISDQLPRTETQRARLDALRGRMSSRVEYTGRSGAYDHSAWRLDQYAAFDLSGRASDRELVNQMRLRFVESPVYRVETRGADAADAFALDLVTTHRSPLSNGSAPQAPATSGPEDGS